MRLMLSTCDDIEVAAEAATAAQALQTLAAARFDVVLLDLGLPDRNGLDLLKLLREKYPPMAVVIVSMQPEDIYAVRAFKLGAAAYLCKDSDEETLVAAVRKAASGGKYVTPSLLQKLAGMIGGGEGAPHEKLTDRELEIFKLIAEGVSLVHIAERLHLSPSTVTTYRARILEKMGLHSNAELTRYALDSHLLS